VKPYLEQHYARQADAMERGPQVYGGDARIAALRAFRRYHKDAHIEMRANADGRNRWMGAKMLRIHAIVHRQAHGEKGLIKVHDIAAEAGCSPGYVSKVVVKLQAWGFFWFVSLRGRNGGLWVFVRTYRDKLDHWAQEARYRLRQARERVLARLALNVSCVNPDRQQEVQLLEEVAVPTSYLLT
jgi:hypothetical protein